jgi:glutathione-specific gamma-glutamylcyclotransferase
LLTREDLTSERIDQIVADARAAGYDFFLSSPEREASLNEALLNRPPDEETWIFAYGSLMWNPALDYAEVQPCRVEGWRRSFCFWTPMGRGTPELPGLMLALADGGACEGIAYRLSPGLERQELFVVETGHCQYCGDLPIERAAYHIAFAEGRRGACREYLLNTAEHARSLGIHDPYLEELVERVTRLREQPTPVSAPEALPLHALAK